MRDGLCSPNRPNHGNQRMSKWHETAFAVWYARRHRENLPMLPAKRSINAPGQLPDCVILLPDADTRLKKLFRYTSDNGNGWSSSYRICVR